MIYESFGLVTQLIQNLVDNNSRFLHIESLHLVNEVYEPEVLLLAKLIEKLHELFALENHVENQLDDVQIIQYVLLLINLLNADDEDVQGVLLYVLDIYVFVLEDLGLFAELFLVHLVLELDCPVDSFENENHKGNVSVFLLQQVADVVERDIEESLVDVSGEVQYVLVES